MSSLTADIIIWVLLLCGIVFCGLGLMGMMLFPDTRSRMFTGFRATAIGLVSVALAVTAYAFTLFTATGSPEYPALILRLLILVLVLAAGTWIMYGIIRERTGREKSGTAGQVPADPGSGGKESGAEKND